MQRSRSSNEPSRLRLQFATWGAAAGLLALSTACTTTRLERADPEREVLSEDLLARFDVPPLELVSEGEPEVSGELRVQSGIVRICGDELRYRTYVRTANDRPAPFLLVLPILAGGESITDRVCRSLARRGFATASLERRWRIFRDRETIPELDEKLVKVVRQHRAFLAWIAHRPEVDGSRLGCFGLSLGGMLTTLLAAVEPRVDCSIICLAGGDFGRLALEADEIKVERWTRQRCSADGISPEELQRRIRAELALEPLAFATTVDPRNVLFVSARFDGVIPKQSRESLWTALGRPERIDLPLGHYTSVVALEWITARAARFAARTFDTPLTRIAVAFASD